MIAKLPLRKRVTLAFILLGFALSALFAAAVIYITEDYEHVIASEILHGQADDYALRIANHLPATLPQTQRLSGYRHDDTGFPRSYEDLPPGVHEDPISDGVHIGVFDTTVGRLFFVIDLSDIERLEKHLNMFLTGFIVLGTGVAAWLGWLLSGAALKPVRTLADAVDAMSVEPEPSNLAAVASDDEVGQLARAIDNYQMRLVDADAREQTFFADASHELRTPLSVIQGVVDVMQDDPHAAPAAQARLGRLARAVRDMRNLLDAMLSAARRVPLTTEVIPAEPFLRAAAEDALVGKPEIILVLSAEGDLFAPRAEARLLVAGLIQRLLHAHLRGRLLAQVDSEGLLLTVEGSDSYETNTQNVTPRADTGSGSALFDRLARRLGWQVEISQGTQIRIRMPIKD